MGFPKAFLLIWGCLNCVHCYFYPLCSSDDKSCTGYFILPDSLQHFFKYTPQIEYKEDEVRDTRVVLVTDFTEKFLDNFNFVFAPITTFYVKNVTPLFRKMEILLIETYPGIQQYFPMLKEKKKVKASSRLYTFFILGSLTLYLVLHVYFTRKLYYHYKSSLRLEYLNRVKKIFQNKE